MATIAEITKGTTVQITRGHWKGRTVTVSSVTSGRVIVTIDSWVENYSPRSLRVVSGPTPQVADAPAEEAAEPFSPAIGSRVRGKVSGRVWEVLEVNSGGDVSTYVKAIPVDLRGNRDSDPARWFTTGQLEPATNVAFTVDITATPDKIWEYEGLDGVAIHAPGVDLRHGHHGMTHRIALEGPGPNGYLLPTTEELGEVIEVRPGDAIVARLTYPFGHLPTTYWRYRVAIRNRRLHLDPITAREVANLR
jgi:hypothetical protein